MELISYVPAGKNYNAFALTGDTKPYKDIIKACGGKWFNRLDVGGSGWVFWQNNVNQAEAILAAANTGLPQEEIARQWAITLPEQNNYVAKPVVSNVSAMS